MNNKTIDYYNQNASKFTNDTLNVNFTETQDLFLSFLPQGSLILDYGCGSGRDTKYFLDKGYHVEALDGSEELCKIASNNTGIVVRHMYFQDLNKEDYYDGIWACSSILHLTIDELKNVLKLINKALKINGYFYTSFKYGTYQGYRNGRYFTDLNEELFSDLLKNLPEMHIVKEWITGDVRPNRGEEKWLNIIIQKQ